MFNDAQPNIASTTSDIMTHGIFILSGMVHIK